MAGKLIMQIGLPGSGKSTKTEEYVREHPNEEIIVANRDTIRTNLFGEGYHNGNFDKKSESKVTSVHHDIIRKGLASGKTVIDDNTNLNPKSIQNLAQLAKNYDARLEQQYFNVSVDEAKRRNKLRGEAGGRLVPEFVIDAMAKNSYDEEGNLKEFIISKNGVFPVSRNTRGMKILKEFNDKLQEENPMVGKNVVLVDVDGTLANNDHHAAYYLGNRYNKKKDFTGFYKAIKEAPVNETVRDLANTMRDKDGVNLFVLTGRDDSYVKELLNFIDKSGLKASRIIAKRHGDYRPDGEYKAEVIEKLKNEGLIIVHAFDDRQSSIDTMERAGIMVSRVDRPNTVIEDGMSAPPMANDTPEVNTIYGSGYCMRCGSKLKDPNKNIGDACRRKM